MIYSDEELKKIIKKYNGLCHIYVEIYKDSIIDKIFFDLDNEKSYENVKKLQQRAEKLGIKHCVVFSGNNFHFYEKCNDEGVKNKKQALTNYQISVAKELGLKYGQAKISDLDSAVRGDIQRVSRVPGTINPKTDLYCCSLTRELLYGGIGEIYKYAKDKHDEMFFYGDKEVKLKDFDHPCTEIIQDLVVETDAKALKIDVCNTFPVCIKKMLANPDLSHPERFAVIMYLKVNGFSKEEVYKILEAHLSPEKYKHMRYDAQEHDQVAYIYERDYFFKHDDVVQMGYCNNPNCELKAFYKKWVNK